MYNLLDYRLFVAYSVHMKTLQELGQEVARMRVKRQLTQSKLALLSGLSRQSISKLEKGRIEELGTRKLMLILEALGLELSITPRGERGTLDQLRVERGGTP